MPLLANRAMKQEARRALDEIGVNVPRLDVPVARLSGGQRQAIAVARTVNSDADIILLDEPLAAMGAKEGAMILDLVARLRAEGRVSIIMIAHNYVHVLQSCDRVNLIQDGEITFDKPTGETSVEELNEIVVEEYRRARLAANGSGGRAERGRRPASIGDRLRDALRARRRRPRRGRRRARLGGPRVRPRRHRARAAGLGARLPRAVGAAGPRGLPRGAARGGARGRRRGRASRPTRSSGSRTDFTASTPLPGARRRHAAVPAARACASARTPTRSCGSTTPPRRRPTASTRSPRERGEPWLARYGGRISSEWEFAKALQVLEEDPEVYERMDRWIEARRLDRLAALRARDAQRVHRRLQGHPPGRPLSRPRTTCARSTSASRDFVAEKIGGPLSPLGARAGDLTAQAARWTGLPEGIAVAVGNVDAHVTAPAARAIEPGQMLAVMGTSTCHVMNGDALAEVPGMCGVVDGGIMPGLWGYEAGQSGVGDIFGWFVDHAVPPALPRGGRARAASTSTRTSPSSPASRRSASTGSSRSTGTTATARSSSTTSSAG